MCYGLTQPTSVLNASSSKGGVQNPMQRQERVFHRNFRHLCSDVSPKNSQINAYRIASFK